MHIPPRVAIPLLVSVGAVVIAIVIVYTQNVAFEERLWFSPPDVSNPLPKEQPAPEGENEAMSTGEDIQDGFDQLTAGWQTYRSEEYGFEVKYPPSWSAVHDPAVEGVAVEDLKGIVAPGSLVYNPNEICLQSGEPGDTYVEFPCTLLVEVHSLNVTSIEEWLRTRDSYFDSQILRDFNAASEWRQIGDKNWFWVEYRDGPGLGELDFFTANDAGTMVVAVTLSEAVIGEEVEKTDGIALPPSVILDILSTFRFLDESRF